MHHCPCSTSQDQEITAKDQAKDSEIFSSPNGNNDLSNEVQVSPKNWGYPKAMDVKFIASNLELIIE